MNKIFYNPKTFEIKGFSDGEITMDLPYVESESIPYLTWNYTIENGFLKVIREQFTPEEWEIILRDGKL